MALLYPWATKEYLLWQMTIGQIILYRNLGYEMKYGTGDGKGRPRSTLDQIKAAKKEFAQQRQAEKQAESEKVKESYRAKYGDI